MQLKAGMFIDSLTKVRYFNASFVMVVASGAWRLGVQEAEKLKKKLL
jgi:hypothetical protein